jgi:hypothetical protein
MAYPTFTLDSNSLTTLGTAKEHLNIPEADTTQDNILKRMINASSALIEEYIDRKILTRTYTEYYDGRGNDRMLLSNWPVTKPTELWDDSSSEFTDSSNLISLADYEVDGDGDTAIGIVLKGLRFGKGTRNIKVIYVAGYATAPYIILESCLCHIEFMYTMRQDRRIGTQTKSKNEENITYRSQLPEFVQNMIDPYRRTEIPLAYRSVRNY